MSTGFKLYRWVLLALTLLVSLGAMRQAQASVPAPVLSYFDWVGSCTDCTTPGNPSNNIITARLTLQDYTLGDDIQSGNFVSFSYSGSNFVDPYTVEVGVQPSFVDRLFNGDAAYVAGNIQSVPGTNRFELVFDDGLHFQTQVGGAWSTCAPGTDINGDLKYYGGTPCLGFNFTSHSDVGTSGTFSTTPIPEPGVWAMLVAGLGVLALARRRRH